MAYGAICNILNLFLIFNMILLKFIILISYLYPVSVTFNVNMQDQYLNGGNVYLAGADTLSLNSFGLFENEEIEAWDPNGIMMQDSDFDGVFSATLELDSNTTYFYKYLNGPEFELANISNRFFETSNNDTILNIECYDSFLFDCFNTQNELVEVTFLVDMQQLMLDSASVVGLLGVNELFTNFGYLNNDLLNPILAGS